MIIRIELRTPAMEWVYLDTVYEATEAEVETPAAESDAPAEQA
mgnify:CR=1 FL=1